MEPRIGHWHCRYRLVGSQQETGLAVERLERAIRPRVAEAYGDALARAFENDPAVYVLRRVNVRLTLNIAVSETEAGLAHEWGRRLGAAVVRGVVAGGEGGGNLARFADEADYVSHFIADLSDGLAWDRWYYGAFAKLRGLSKAEAILALLFERRESLQAVVGRLSSLGCLERVLALLGRPATAKLWAAMARREAVAPDANAFRLFVRGAMRLLDLLGLWAAAAPAEARLLEEYVAERPTVPDWSDRRSLASAVLGVVRHARRRAYLVVGFGPEAMQKLSQSREEIRTEFDWLDAEWLTDALPAALAERTDGSAESQLATLPTRAVGVTPLQRKLLELVRELLLQGKVKLVPGRAGSAENATRLYAALAATDAESAARPAAASLVENLLLCAEWCASAHAPADALAAVRAGADAVTLGRQPPAALRAIFSSGPTAADVLAEIVRQTSPRLADTDETVLQTECAGLFLVIRAVLDMRLPQLASAASAGPLSSVLLALGIQWAGKDALHDGEMDAGLAFWCGLGLKPHQPTSEILSALDEAGCQRLLARAGELLEARRSLHPSLASVGETPSEETLAELTVGWPADAPVRRELVLVAIYALRLWAQWLPGIAGSSVPYLLRQLLRRGGELRVREHCVEVALRPAPLDVVLEMASYTKELSCVSWLADRKVTFRIDRS